MFDKALFLYYVTRKNMTLGTISTMLEINPATLTRKMSGESDFTRDEVQRLKKILGLSVIDADKIFLQKNLRERKFSNKTPLNKAKEVRGWRALPAHIAGRWYDVEISAHGAAVSWLRSVIVG